MHDDTTKLLLKKVKKHKKWTEGVFVNPMYWEVNGTPYYMAGFTKNNEAIETAYLTIGKESVEEAMEAQLHLAIFADLSNNIFNIGMDRLKIPAGFYTKPLGIAVQTEDKSVQQGREAFAELWKIQQTFNDLMNDYKAYYDEDVLIRKRLTEKDILKTQETANLVNIYQYQTLKNLLDHNADIKAFAAYLETTEQWSGLSKEDRKFLNGITDNVETMQKNLTDLQLIEDDDLHRMIQLNYDQMIEKNKKIILGQRQYIRYPKQ